MYKILSLAGGGVKGYLTLEILKYLEQQSGQKISDMFDLVVGTSAGALIGILLDDYSAKDISNNLRNNLVNELFTPNTFSCGGLLQSKYNTFAKEECLKNLLDYKYNLRHFDYAAISYDIKNNKPVIFNTLEEEITDTYYLKKYGYTFTDACLASSAAPIYWDPFITKNSVYIDGGICANNPVSIAIKLALNKNIKLEDLHIVNIGTGINTRKYNIAKGNNHFKWMLPLFNVMMNAQSNISNMLYENESLHYYNLDIPLTYASDDIDCITEVNFNNLILDSKELIKQKKVELHTILHTFI
jgi:patatin-like phospholipase/acyl hydrolase